MECCFCCCTKETSGVSVKTNLIFIVTFQFGGLLCPTTAA
jgi:hypothetical protein